MRAPREFAGAQRAALLEGGIQVLRRRVRIDGRIVHEAPPLHQPPFGHSPERALSPGTPPSALPKMLRGSRPRAADQNCRRRSSKGHAEPADNAAMPKLEAFAALSAKLMDPFVDQGAVLAAHALDEEGWKTASEHWGKRLKQDAEGGGDLGARYGDAFTAARALQSSKAERSTVEGRGFLNEGAQPWREEAAAVALSPTGEAGIAGTHLPGCVGRIRRRHPGLCNGRRSAFRRRIGRLRVDGLKDPQVFDPSRIRGKMDG
jgi:hypothetical protein